MLFHDLTKGEVTWIRKQNKAENNSSRREFVRDLTLMSTGAAVANITTGRLSSDEINQDWHRQGVGGTGPIRRGCGRRHE